MSDLHEMESLVHEWDDLAENAIHRNVAFESSYLLPAIRHLATQPVRILVVENVTPDGSQIVGLAPFTETRVLRLPFSAIQVWKQEQIFDSTPLLRSGWSELAWQEIIGALRSEKIGFLELDTVSAEEPFAELVEQTSKQIGGLFCKKSFERAALIPMETADEYKRNAISSSLRKKLRRLFRRLEDKGEVSFEMSSTDSDYELLTEQFLALEQSGWKGQNGTALASQSHTREFFCDMAQLSLAKGKARFLTMRLNDQPIAMLADLQSGKKAFAYKTAFDESFAPFSPGLQIELKNIELIHRDQIEFADSCTSSESSSMTRVWGERSRFQHVLLPLKSGLPKWITALLPTVQKLRQWVRGKR